MAWLPSRSHTACSELPIRWIATYPGDSNYTNGSGTGAFTAFLAPTITFLQVNPSIVVTQPLIIQISVSNSTNAQFGNGTITLSSGTYNSGPIQQYVTES